MKLSTSLAVGVVALLAGGSAVFAQEAPKTAAAAPAEAPEKIQKVLGTYKSDTPGPPAITLAWKDGKLMMEASGFPAIEVTLGEKGELKSAVLPPTFSFTLVLDADGKATALKLDTPMGGGELKRQADAKPVEVAKKDEIPDILGVYEPDQKVEGVKAAEVVFEKGKLWVKMEGQQPFSFTLGKDDKLVVDPALPEGTSIKLVRDKDGKVVGSEYAGPEGTMKFTRKVVAKSEFPDVLGKYEADDAASPIPGGEMLIEGGTLVLRVDGQPDFPVKIDKDGNVLSDKFPEGVTSKLRKDKDGKVTGLDSETPLGKLSFTRKTFVPLPGAAKAEDPKLARLKAICGTYKSDAEGVPVLTISLKDGKLILQPEGIPQMEADLTKDDMIVGETIPPGFELKIVRDKDGKVTGLNALTPMGTAEFKFTPEKEKKADK